MARPERREGGNEAARVRCVCNWKRGKRVGRLAALSQRSARMRQVGFLYPGPQTVAPTRVASFMSGLQSGGLPAEQVTIVLRVTGGDAALLGPMAADLVAGKVDLIFAIGPAGSSSCSCSHHQYSHCGRRS